MSAAAVALATSRPAWHSTVACVRRCIVTGAGVQQRRRQGTLVACFSSVRTAPGSRQGQPSGGYSSAWSKHNAASSLCPVLPCLRVARAGMASATLPTSSSASGVHKGFTLGDVVRESQDGPLRQTQRPVRNVAVIAHVDHGKTTLVDTLMDQAGEVRGERAMDWDALEQERGITILSKATALEVQGKDGELVTLNIVDTPGHADFGGEVERVLSMVDGVMLVVDAGEGPMAQTKFVLAKALAAGLRPVVVFNKVDRDTARLGEVENEVFDLFVALDATDEQLDFPMVYASAKEGWATMEPDDVGSATPPANMDCLTETLLEHVAPPAVLGGADDPFRMLVTQMDRDKFMGRLAIGRIASGCVRVGDTLCTLKRDGSGSEPAETARVTKILARRGLQIGSMEEAVAGDIVQIAGFAEARPTDSLVAPEVQTPMFADPVDPPTISMLIGVNDSPIAGKGTATRLTSSMIQDRLRAEAETNIALHVGPAPPVDGMADMVEVRGRGELQLAVLIETMRREGFELSVSPPRVLLRRAGPGGTDPTSGAAIEGVSEGDVLEPFETVVIDVDEEYTGMVIEKVSQRKGELQNFGEHAGKTRLTFLAPARGLIGFQSQFKTDTKGTGVINRAVYGYGPFDKTLETSTNGALISSADGKTSAYALNAIEPRGRLFLGPGVDTYPGMVIGQHARANDLEVNPVRAKKLTNMRAAGSDETIRLTPPLIMPLEEAITYVGSDELVEVTPEAIRLRKLHLDSNKRKQVSRQKRGGNFVYVD